MILRAVAPESVLVCGEPDSCDAGTAARVSSKCAYRHCEPLPSGPIWLRVFDLLLAPLYHLIAYRSDLDPSALLAKSGRDLIEMRPVNLLGYSSVLVCRSP